MPACPWTGPTTPLEPAPLGSTEGFGRPAGPARRMGWWDWGGLGRWRGEAKGQCLRGRAAGEEPADQHAGEPPPSVLQRRASRACGEGGRAAQAVLARATAPQRGVEGEERACSRDCDSGARARGGFDRCEAAQGLQWSFLHGVLPAVGRHWGLPPVGPSLPASRGTPYPPLPTPLPGPPLVTRAVRPISRCADSDGPDILVS
jgi:hypothetical protein